MFLALGVGAWSAAIFHFMTHAFFKALLFLAAGRGHPGAAPRARHVQDGRPAASSCRWSFWTFLIGAASLAALPLVTAGFYSKDLILCRRLGVGRGRPLALGGGAGRRAPHRALHLPHGLPDVLRRAQDAGPARGRAAHRGCRWSCWPSCRSSAASSSCRATLGDRPLVLRLPAHRRCPTAADEPADEHRAGACRSWRRVVSLGGHLRWPTCSSCGSPQLAEQPGAHAARARRCTASGSPAGASTGSTTGCSSGPSSGSRAPTAATSSTAIYAVVAWIARGRSTGCSARRRPGRLRWYAAGVAVGAHRSGGHRGAAMILAWLIVILVRRRPAGLAGRPLEPVVAALDLAGRALPSTWSSCSWLWVQVLRPRAARRPRGLADRDRPGLDPAARHQLPPGDGRPEPAAGRC